MTFGGTAEARATAQLCSLNDQFRRSFAGGRVVTTSGVAALSTGTLAKAIEGTKAFDNFDAANDPHGEHDFGTLQVDGVRIFWKIDCYDQTLPRHSPDSSDARVTQRVLTIMLASEY